MPAAAPTAWAYPGTGGASLPATLWFADRERQLPIGIRDRGLLSAVLQRRGAREASPALPANSHSAVESHPVEAVADVLLTVHSHLAQPDHLALRDILLQLALHQRYQPRLLAGLRPHQQHIAGVTAPLKQRSCNTEQREQPGLRSPFRPSTSPPPRPQAAQEVPGVGVLLQLPAGGLRGRDLPLNAMIWSVLLRSSNRTLV